MNFGTLGDVWGGFWEPRTAREKLLLTWGGVVLAVVIAYSVLWAPAQQGRAHLRQSLPAMQRHLVVPLNEVPTGEPAATSTWSWLARGFVPVSLYQARPNLFAASFRTKVAVNPQSGEKALGMTWASDCQSMLSPCWLNSV